jgi:hypothetical protein
MRPSLVVEVSLRICLVKNDSRFSMGISDGIKDRAFAASRRGAWVARIWSAGLRRVGLAVR